MGESVLPYVLEEEDVLAVENWEGLLVDELAGTQKLRGAAALVVMFCCDVVQERWVDLDSALLRGVVVEHEMAVDLKAQFGWEG